MDLLAYVLSGAVLAFAPNGWWVDEQLQIDQVEQRMVPSSWLAETPSSVWLVFHEIDRLPMAAYVPPDADELRLARAMPALLGAFERLLPELDIPRILLRSSVYRQPDGRLTPATGWPADSASHLFGALLAAHLERVKASRPELEKEIERRAASTIPEVPKELRGDVFAGMVVEFGGHVLSVAHELGRHVRRHGDAKMCAILEHPATLFGSWGRAFERDEFRGFWARPADSAAGASRRDVMTRRGLSRDDKAWIATEILDTDWVGDPAVDFATLCRSSD